MRPGIVELLVLVLGTMRIVRLIGWDNFPLAERARAWATGQTHYYNSTEGGDVFRYRRPMLEHFLGCPWCLGFHLSLVVYLLWLWFPTETTYVLMPFALSAAVGLIAKNLDP